MKIGSLRDLLAFVDEVAGTAEAHFRKNFSEGSEVDQNELLVKLFASQNPATHLERMAGVGDPDLTRAAGSVLYLRKLIRAQADRLAEHPDEAAAKLAALVWMLHQEAAALHGDALEKVLKIRPARQARRREGKYGLVRRVLQIAVNDGATSTAAVRDWLSSRRRVELDDGDVTIRTSDGAWELEQPAKDRCATITPEVLVKTLGRIQH